MSTGPEKARKAEAAFLLGRGKEGSENSHSLRSRRGPVLVISPTPYTHLHCPLTSPILLTPAPTHTKPPLPFLFLPEPSVSGLAHCLSLAIPYLSSTLPSSLLPQSPFQACHLQQHHASTPSHWPCPCPPGLWTTRPWSPDRKLPQARRCYWASLPSWAM